ncbi:MAG TPA: uroporphyrinogen-III synthase [Sphingomicrobium sp.]|nr:uroporphyrinogen-III synthase [Sphingomicrobium sp.]
MRRLFVFRPEPAAQQTVRTAKSLGLDAVSIPLFELQAVDWTVPDAGDFDAILLTSANTVRLAAEGLAALRVLPVHAVGEGTAVAARAAGLGVATVGCGGVDDLLAQVPAEARLLHLCGEDKREPATAGRFITSIAVYRANEKAAVPGLRALQGQAAVVHSPRAARRLAELVSRDVRSTICLAAISEATAEAAGKGWKEVRTASAPRDTELLALAARLCET